MKAIQQVMALAMMAGGGMDCGYHSNKKEENEVKKCLNPVCNNLHNHNNICCSAECFKEHKEYLKRNK